MLGVDRLMMMIYCIFLLAVFVTILPLVSVVNSPLSRSFGACHRSRGFQARSETPSEFWEVPLLIVTS